MVNHASLDMNVRLQFDKYAAMCDITSNKSTVIYAG